MDMHLLFSISWCQLKKYHLVCLTIAISKPKVSSCVSTNKSIWLVIHICLLIGYHSISAYRWLYPPASMTLYSSIILFSRSRFICLAPSTSTLQRFIWSCLQYCQNATCSTIFEVELSLFVIDAVVTKFTNHDAHCCVSFCLYQIAWN